MTNTRVAQRYALALIELAEETGTAGTIDADAAYLFRLMSQSAEFGVFLRSPVINHHRKKKILTEILKGKISDLMLNFTILLASKNREELLGEVIRQFFPLREKRQGIVTAEVRTVVPLTSGEQESLRAKLSKNLGKTVRMRTALEPSLRGGFTVRFDDTIWDASVRRRLEVLRHRLITGG